MTDKPVLQHQEDNVGVITLNRPDVLNALNGELISALNAALRNFTEEPEIGALLLTGNARAFAAGADISEMVDLDAADIYLRDFFTGTWEQISACRKPIIAAVSGFALGGGCELAMMCDFIIAADNARFGQPEVKLGVLPGLGGTQRLTHLVGKSKAMDMCLTGRMMDAQEAERAGLVSRVVPADNLLAEAMEAARRIAGYSRSAVLRNKEAVNMALETTLATGLRYERRLFHASFASPDQREGMRAFLDKRPPNWQVD